MQINLPDPPVCGSGGYGVDEGTGKDIRGEIASGGGVLIREYNNVTIVAAFGSFNGTYEIA